MKTIKVAKIIDERNIVLNCGDNDGISIGNKFKIFSKKSSLVIDPDTGKPLGNLRLIKAKVQAVTVYDKMCICQSIYSTMSMTVLSSISALNDNAQLKVDPSQITGGLDSETDEMIQIGDEAERYD